jgi:hypothetical protein
MPDEMAPEAFPITEASGMMPASTKLGAGRPRSGDAGADHLGRRYVSRRGFPSGRCRPLPLRRLRGLDVRLDPLVLGSGGHVNRGRADPAVPARVRALLGPCFAGSDAALGAGRLGLRPHDHRGAHSTQACPGFDPLFDDGGSQGASKHVYCVLARLPSER